MIEDITSQHRPSADAPEAPFRLTERERVVLQRFVEGLTCEEVQTVEAISFYGRSVLRSQVHTIF